MPTSIQAHSMDFAKIRQQFPALRHASAPYHYLDSAASTHKPDTVIEAITSAYSEHYAPVHRGLYQQAETASQLYEGARQRLADFICAPDKSTIVFTRSATESINLIAEGWARPRLKEGDEIWVSVMEHHANYLPWQRLCKKTGARLRVIPITDQGELDLDTVPELFSSKTRLIAITMVSNVLGTSNPVKSIISRAKENHIPVLLDAAQAIAHEAIDVQALDCDFLVASAHKMYGANGIGLLYAKKQRLEETEPLLLGGGMVDEVGGLNETATTETRKETSWSEIPTRFEAGSPNFSGALSFAAAADFIQGIGFVAIEAHLKTLTRYAVEQLQATSGLHLYGSPKSEQHSGILSFDLEGVHPHDVAHIAGEAGVAIRAGHHCCQPLMHRLGISGTNRASVAIYNNHDDIDALAATLETARKLFL